MEVFLYTRDGDVGCSQVRLFLQEHKIAFEEISLDTHPERLKEVVSKSGQVSVPLLDVNGHILLGYHPETLKRIFHL